MDIVVFLAVLAAAAAHAGWNAVIKGGGDPLVLTAILSFAAGVLGIPLLAITGLPNLAAMPWVVASVVVHIAYFGSLIQTYRYGDLGQVYPIARGGAPLMTAIGGTVLFGGSCTHGQRWYSRNAPQGGGANRRRTRLCSTRMAHDVDILVPPERFADAMDVLFDMGWMASSGESRLCLHKWRRESAR